MTDIPHVIAGGMFTKELYRITEAYMREHGMPMTVGFRFNVDLVNDAIDWWNALQPEERDATHRTRTDVSDYISDQLRAKAAALRNSIVPPAARLTGWSPPSSKALAKEQSARKSAAEQAQAAALAEWEELCRQSWISFFNNSEFDASKGSVLLGLLDLHKPYLGEYSYRVECDHCLEGSYDVERAEWPCASYAIIKEGMA